MSCFTFTEQKYKFPCTSLTGSLMHILLPPPLQSFIINYGVAQACFSHMFSHDSNYNVQRKVCGYVNDIPASFDSSCNSSVWDSLVYVCYLLFKHYSGLSMILTHCNNTLWLPKKLECNVVPWVTYRVSLPQLAIQLPLFIGWASKQITQIIKDWQLNFQQRCCSHLKNFRNSHKVAEGL